MNLRLKILILSLSFITKTKAQNLVPNFSFENYSQCPSAAGQVNYINNWYNPSSTGSPDYYNGCCIQTNTVGVPSNDPGFQYANSGNAYVGIVVFGPVNMSVREYVQVALIDTLKKDSSYCVKFYTNMANIGNCAITKMGLYISDTAVFSNDYYAWNVTAQITSPEGYYLKDTLNWMEVSGTYTAHGGEKYITIGNFNNDANTDTIYWGQPFSPGTYYYIDDVSIIKCTGTTVKEYSNDVSFKLYPIPNDGNMMFEYTLPLSSTGQLDLYDITGKIIDSYFLLEGNANKLKINQNQLDNGIYFYSVIVDNKVKEHHKFVIIK